MCWGLPSGWGVDGHSVRADDLLSGRRGLLYVFETARLGGWASCPDWEPPVWAEGPPVWDGTFRLDGEPPVWARGLPSWIGPAVWAEGILFGLRTFCRGWYLLFVLGASRRSGG